jgi:hypothetical protein
MTIPRLAPMRRRTPIALLSCALTLAIAGCGSGDGTIPEDESSTLLTLLASTQDAITEGDCELAQGLTEEFVSETASLPDGVDAKVAEELTTAARNLNDLASQPGECTETGATGLPEEEPEVSTPTETEPAETAEEPETTEEPEPTDEPEPTEEPQQEPPSEPTQQPPANNGGNPGGGTVSPPSGGVGAGGGAG